MPLQRRLPKFGFHSRTAGQTTEVRLDELSKASVDVIDLQSLKDAKIVSHKIKRVKVIASGALGATVTLKGLLVTKGARAAIESVGGKVEE